MHEISDIHVHIPGHPIEINGKNCSKIIDPISSLAVILKVERQRVTPLIDARVRKSTFEMCVCVWQVEGNHIDYYCRIEYILLSAIQDELENE